MDKGGARSEAGRESRQEGVGELLGLMGEAANVVSVGHEWFGEGHQMGSGIVDGDPNVSLEVPNRARKGGGGDGAPEMWLQRGAGVPCVESLDCDRIGKLKHVRLGFLVVTVRDPAGDAFVGNE